MQFITLFQINLLLVFSIFFSFKIGLGESLEETGKAKLDSLKTVKKVLPHFQPVPDRWQGIKLMPYELKVTGHIYDP